MAGAITAHQGGTLPQLDEVHPLSKHVTPKLVKQKKIMVEYIPTQDMVADIMTKSLPHPGFEKFWEAMGVVRLPL